MGDETLDEETEARVDEAIFQFLTCEDAGEAPSPQEWIRRHPDLAPQLRDYFESRLGIERFAAGTGFASGIGTTAGPLDTVACGPGAGVPAASGEGLPRPFGKYELLGVVGRGGQG